MRKIISLAALILIFQHAFSQNISPDILSKTWNAYWIDVPGCKPHDYGVYHFRKKISLREKPSQFIIHVSADNRYKLFVNGQMASFGPAKGDLYHWNFETVDIAPYLTEGENVLAAVVWNFGEERAEWQISYQTAFILQGNSSTEYIANTDTSWKCIQNSAYSALQPQLTYTYYAAGPGEKVDMNLWPSGWEESDLDDNTWKNAESIFRGVPKMAFDFSTGWMLVPRSIPMMEITTQRLEKIRMQTGTNIGENFLQGDHAVTIPAHATVHILFDQSFLTTAFPVLKFGKGKKADVSLTYAEALFINEGDSKNWRAQNQKGNRNEVEGKRMVGLKDEVISNGKEHQSFTALAWRCYRYVALDITTHDEPLLVQDIYGLYTGYPFTMNARFESGNDTLHKILETGWRTARLDAHETYTDCPFYEQLQYVGDTRIQAMVSLYNSGDDRLMRNAIEQIANSMLAEGITESRFPTRSHQEIPTFSLIWISMLHDYWMYRGDSNFIRNQLRISRQVLSFFHNLQTKDGSLHRVPYWIFTDWVEKWDGGIAPIDKNGYSSLLDLQLLMAYEAAEDLERNSGMNIYAEMYDSAIVQLKKSIYANYWDDNRKLLSDTKEKKFFSQHANALAILTGVINRDDVHVLGQKLLSDTSLAPASVYFRYYLYQALTKAGFGDQYLNWLGIWKQNLAMGLTTWAEIDDINRARSDCHAWGSSPNIELYRIVLGIDTDAPGFSKVKIEPHLGALTKVSGSIPHPKGNVSASYELKNGNWSINIQLPQEITGKFLWKGSEYDLKEGENKFALE
ncbi:MAG TPA: alpha-L-rhamnosidase N-terminal domain-containing protein [Parafilimonas sp.]|nr:alpha-L-rhamnosidase N-terminal domain-containing protein [Parafilimonas sp.]